MLFGIIVIWFSFKWNKIDFSSLFQNSKFSIISRLLLLAIGIIFLVGTIILLPAGFSLTISLLGYALGQLTMMALFIPTFFGILLVLLTLVFSLINVYLWKENNEWQLRIKTLIFSVFSLVISFYFMILPFSGFR